jgi:hypothetical protein
MGGARFALPRAGPELAGPLKDNLFSFVSKHGGNWEEEQVPSELALLLVDG